MSEKNNQMALIIFSGDMDKVFAGLNLAIGAVSSGMESSIYFAFWGLNVLRRKKCKKVKKPFLDKLFGMMMPCGIEKLKISKMNMGGLGTGMMKHIMKKKGVCSLSGLLDTAKEMGVRLVACQLSMETMGITQEELIDGLDYGSVATYLEGARKSNINLFI